MSFPSKTIILVAIVAMFFKSTCTSEREEPDFCYRGEDCGPESLKWSGACKTGKNQSPISLSRLVDHPHKVPLHFHEPGYKSDTGFWVRNNGHTIQVSLEPEPTSFGKMSGYEMPPDGYIFAQIHFHWGEDAVHGSEHTLGDKQYPLEVHLVHYDASYPSFEAAATSGNPQGLAVLAIFITPGSESDINPGFDTMVEHLPFHYQEEARHFNESLDLRSFLPGDGAPFFRYIGSLTTPNCTEAVQWTVMAEPIQVKPSEIEKFHLIFDHAEHLLDLNYRPLQPLNNRKVQYLAKDYDYQTDASSKPFLSIISILLVTFSIVLS